jgi:hypothetical protein
MEPSVEEVANVRRALKRLRSEPVGWGPVTTGGHTPARRWVVTLEDGRRAFVKVATDDLTASWLREEHRYYAILRGAPFMPTYVGFYDDGRHPVLALEDLSAAEWPPPWSPERVEAVRACLDLVHATPVPEDTPSADDDRLELREGWEEIAAAPEPFLAFGLCSPDWLDRALPELRGAAGDAGLAGDAFLHFDVRSDNVCFRPGGEAVLVDWNWTSEGNPLADLAFWLPSLQVEGGPAPDEVLPAKGDGMPELAACVAGFFAAHAARAPIASAPGVRPLQLRQARAALPWAARALGLPAPA